MAERKKLIKMYENDCAWFRYDYFYNRPWCDKPAYKHKCNFPKCGLNLVKNKRSDKKRVKTS